MAFSLDDYISKNKLQGEGGLNAAKPGGFSLDDYIIKNNIRSGELRKEDDEYNAWLKSMSSFADQMSKDYASREGKYQTADSFGSYQTNANSQIDALIQQGYNAQNYYNKYGSTYDEVYGQGSSAKLLEVIAGNLDYLNGLRKELQNEADFWGYFPDEASYTQYQKQQEYAALPEKEDFAEGSKYTSTYKGEKTVNLPYHGESYQTKDFGDLRYDYINKNPDAINPGSFNNNLEKMTDDEVARFNYLYAQDEKNGDKAHTNAYAYISYLTPSLFNRPSDPEKATQEAAALKEKSDYYTSLKGNADFADKSQYKTTENHHWYDFLNLDGQNYGFDDLQYDVINRNPTAVNRQQNLDMQSDATLMGMDRSFLQQLTDDEIATFNYLYAQDEGNGDKKHSNAYAYIDFLKSELHSRQRKEEEAWATDFAKEHPFISSATTILTSPMKASGYLFQAADYLNDGKIDQNAAYNRNSYLSGAIRNEVASHFGPIGSNAYQIGMSLADFVTTTVASAGQEWLSLGIMGASAAADHILNMKDQGYDDNRAFGIGTMAGIVEIVTEKIGWDALFDKKLAGKSALKYLLRNVLSEGFEEASSDVLNLLIDEIADILFNEDQSELKRTIAAYMANGKSESEAVGLAVGDKAIEMGVDFLGGAISGGVMGGFGLGVNTILNNAQAQQYRGNLQGVIDQAKAFAPESELTQKVQDKINNGKKVSGNEIMGLVEDIQEGYQNQNRESIAEMATERLKQLGQTEGVEELSNAIAKKLNGEKLSLSENWVIQSSKNAKSVLNEMKTVSDATGLFESAMKSVLDGKSISEETASDILDNNVAVDMLKMATGLELNEDMTKSERTEAIRNAIDSFAKSAETENDATVANNTAAVQRAVSGTQNAVDMLERASTTFGENGAKALKAAYDGIASADDYYAGFAAYYNAGVSGADMNSVKSRYAENLTEAQKFAAYSAGQNDAKSSLESEKNSVKSATVYGKEAGFIQNEYSKNLSKKNIERMDKLGKSLGTKIQMVAPTGAKGANGWYKNGVICIAADAQNPYFVVFAHELTHRLQELAPEEYRAFRDYCIHAKAKELGGTSALIKQYKDRYSEIGENLTTEQAMDEIAADYAMEMVEKGVLFEDYAKENLNTAERILGWLKEFISKIKALFKGETQNTAAEEAAGVDLKTMEEAAQLWKNALEKAKSQVRQMGETATKNAAMTQDGEKGKTKFSTKAYSNEEKMQHINDAVAYFGRTYKWSETGYITTDGKRLDFSGRHEGAQGGYRTVDHRDIRDAMGDNYGGDDYSGSMVQFMSEGNIRISPESGGINLSVMPTKAQLDVLSDFISKQRGEVILDLDTTDGNTVSSTEYPRGTHANKVLADIKAYFEDGTQPYVSEISRFRYSLKKDSNGKELTDGQRSYFQNSKVVDERGRLLVMYHGTPDAGFTVFRSGSYFTQNKQYAEVYQSPSASSLRPGKKSNNPGLYSVYLNITKPFDTREPAARKIFYEEYYRKYGTGTDLMESGLPDWMDGMDLQEFLEENGYDYDGLILDEGGTGGYGEEVKSRGLSYVAFYPEQVKNTDNLNPTKDKDVRFSLKGRNIQQEMRDLKRQNDSLKERVDYWKSQTKRTKVATTDKKAVAKAARSLVSEYTADVDKDSITAKLQKLYDYIAGNGDGKNELTWEGAYEQARSIAEELVSNAVMNNADLYNQYSDLRSYLRDAQLTISEEDSHNIPDFAQWRKSQFGRMNIRKGKTNIDSYYHEMSELWPEFFAEERESHPADQLERIAEVLNELYNVEQYNPFSGYVEQAIEGAANEIMEQFFDLPQTKPTFADKQAKKMDELREKNRMRTQEAVAREWQSKEAQILRLKERFKDDTDKLRSENRKKELLAKIVRHANALSQKLLKPNDKQNIPQKLRSAVASMLDAINLESRYTTDPITGRRVKDGNGDPAKRTEAFRQLRLFYEKITEDGADYTMVIDPNLKQNLSDLDGMRNIPIAKMNAEQLQTVWETIKAVEASIRTENKLFGESKFKTILEFAEGIRDDNRGRYDRGNFKGFAGALDNLANLDMLTPQSFFHRLGATGEAMFRMMRNAQDKHIRIMAEAKAATSKIIGDTDIRKLQKETHTFDIGDSKVTLSTPQIMALYELWKREQAREHILTGGIRPETVTSKGLKEHRMSEPIRVTLDDVTNIISVLTKEQIALADALQQYMSNELAKLGNEASMEVYGYEKFGEENYFPIKVDRNQTKQDIAKDATASTIAGRGFTKSTKPHANNAVMLDSIFDVYSAHVTDMATYAAWLPTMENIRRIRDFTFWDNGARTGSVKGIIERVFGRNGNVYLNQLIDDINQGVKADYSSLTDIFVSGFKASAISANIRVIVQQPTAILRAMSMIDGKYLASSLNPLSGWEKAKKYAPIAVWKDWGYFDVGTGRQMQSVLFDNDSLLGKANNTLMSAAGFADSVAWGQLWNAVEAETKDKHAALRPGSEEFNKAVAERFTEIIDATQVVDGILQRSGIMRSKNGITKMATSFMAEPTKVYNMFTNAVYDIRYANEHGARIKAIKNLARTSFALVASFAANAAAQSLIDAMRDDDRDKKYWERFFEKFGGNFGSNFNPGGYLPYVKDVVSTVQGYKVSRMDMESIQKVVTAAQDVHKALNGKSKRSVASTMVTLLAEAARFFGIPLATIKRDLLSVLNSSFTEMDNYVGEYMLDKAIYNIQNISSWSIFYDTLYRAYTNDQKQYEILYNKMIADGIPAKNIKSAMESRMKKAQGVDSRYLDPTQEREYSSYQKKISGSQLWRKATTEQRESLEDDLYKYVTGDSFHDKIADGKKYGLDTAEYLLYRLALNMVDKPNESGDLGTFDAEEKEEALKLMTGLTKAEKEYLRKLR